MWRGPPDHPRCDLGGTSSPSVCTSESFHWSGCGMGMNGGTIPNREKHGKDMDLWIAVNCPGLRIPEFLSLGLGWSAYVLIVK